MYIYIYIPTESASSISFSQNLSLMRKLGEIPRECFESAAFASFVFLLRLRINLVIGKHRTPFSSALIAIDVKDGANVVVVEDFVRVDEDSLSEF